MRGRECGRGRGCSDGCCRGCCCTEIAGPFPRPRRGSRRGGRRRRHLRCSGRRRCRCRCWRLHWRRRLGGFAWTCPAGRKEDAVVGVVVAGVVDPWSILGRRCGRKSDARRRRRRGGWRRHPGRADVRMRARPFSLHFRGELRTFRARASRVLRACVVLRVYSYCLRSCTAVSVSVSVTSDRNSSSRKRPGEWIKSQAGGPTTRGVEVLRVEADSIESSRTGRTDMYRGARSDGGRGPHAHRVATKGGGRGDTFQSRTKPRRAGRVDAHSSCTIERVDGDDGNDIGHFGCAPLQLDANRRADKLRVRTMGKTRRIGSSDQKGRRYGAIQGKARQSIGWKCYGRWAARRIKLRPLPATPAVNTSHSL